MSIPLTITATVAAWITDASYHGPPIRAIERGDNHEVMNTLHFYGPAEKQTFSSFTRVGEADITVRLAPKDEQTRIAVQALQAKLAEDRAKWHERQQALLDEISKLQALTFDGEPE